MNWTAADPAWVDAEVARLAATGAVEAVAARPAVVSPLLLAPKAGPKQWRLVVDLRALNAALPHRAAKAEGLPDLLRLAARHVGHRRRRRRAASYFHQERCQCVLHHTAVLPFSLACPTTPSCGAVVHMMATSLFAARRTSIQKKKSKKKTVCDAERRIGGATAAVQGGASMAVVKAVGGWSSDTVRRYARPRCGLTGQPGEPECIQT